METLSIGKPLRRYKAKLVIAGFASLGLSTGILINSVGQFILPINKDMGYGVGIVSMAFSIVCAGIIFDATAVAKFIDRYSSRACIALSAGVLAIFALLISFTTEIWQFYICSIIIGLAFTGLHTIPVSVMINKSFSQKRRGLAISISFSGSGIGGMVFNPILNSVISAYGWRMGFMTIACTYFIGGLFIVCLMKPPKGVKEYIESLDRASNGYVNNVESHDLEYRKALRTGRFLRLGISLMIISGVGSTIMMHTVPFMIDIGISPSSASFFISACLLILAFDKIIFGYICDRVGVPKGTIFGVICFICGTFVMLALNISQWIYLAFLIFGTMGLSSSTVIVPLMVSYLFDDKGYARILGATMVFLGVGNTMFPALMGFLFDITGSYNIGWALNACMLILALVICIINFKKNSAKSSRRDLIN